MSTADATRDDAQPRPSPAPPADEGHSAGSGLPPAPLQGAASPGWILRATSLTGGIAGILGIIAAPGVRGNASEAVVTAMDVAGTVGAYFFALLLIVLALWGGLDLLKARPIPVGARVALVAASAVVVGMSSPGLHDRLPPAFAVVLAAGAAVASLAGAYAAAGAPHTRAAAGVLCLMAFAAIARLAAWEVAMHAGDTASVQLFATSRALATTGILFEAGAQLLVVMWLGTRSRGAGQLGSSAALVGAFVLTWGVARGVHSDASFWQSVLHTALADAPGVPSPYGLDALATFVVPASLLLSLATALQPRQVPAMTAAMALVLVSRGAFDAPIRALCAVVAAQWAVLSRADTQAMWQTLIAERKARIDEAAPTGRSSGPSQSSGGGPTHGVKEPGPATGERRPDGDAPNAP